MPSSGNKKIGNKTCYTTVLIVIHNFAIIIICVYVYRSLVTFAYISSLITDLLLFIYLVQTLLRVGCNGHCHDKKG